MMKRIVLLGIAMATAWFGYFLLTQPDATIPSKPRVQKKTPLIEKPSGKTSTSNSTQTPPKVDFPHLNKAEDFLRSGNLKRALRFFEKHLNENTPNSALKKRIAIVYHNFAADLMNDGHLGRSLDAAARGLELEPSSLALKKLRSLILSRLAKEEPLEEQKKTYLNEALEDHPTNLSALLQRAEMAEEENDLETALALYEKAAQSDTDITGLETKISRLKRSFNVEKDFTTIEHHHFVARFEGYAQERLAWVALNVLEKAYFTINERLHLEPDEKITVVIYTGDQFRSALNVPDWSGGIYDGKIRIREGDLLAQQNKLQDILYHEYTHALLASHAGPRIPTWFNEGMAQLMEPGYSERTSKDQMTQLFQGAAQQGVLFTPTQLSGSFLSIENPQIVQLAYAQSASWTEALVKRQGYFGTSQLIRHFSESQNFTTSFEERFFISLNGFFKRWQQSQGLE